jgi:polyvinyl alcohol dehydrogenase (cytochrome)
VRGRWITLGVAATMTVAACSGASRPAPPTSASTRPATSGPPAASTTTNESPASASSPASNWTTYAGANDRLGVAPNQPSLDPIRLIWSSTLDGSAVSAQPLIDDGRVFAVTEDDDVYGLDARTGAVLWKVNIGRPLTDVASVAGCGDIDPLGITSTPVIDTATGTLYVVGEVSTAGGVPVHHELVGLDIADGRITMSVDADPPQLGAIGQNPVHLLQRAALALSAGRVYIGYGGQYGDCGSYHGWVVAVDLADHGANAFDVTPDSSGGAVWQGGAAPSVDKAGELYVITGNANSAGAAPYAEAVVKLGADLAPEASFKDTRATDDLDFGTGDPALLPNGELVAAGKTDVGYVLSQAGLQLVDTIEGQVCGSDPDGGEAFDAAADSVYLPCQDGGVQQIDLARNRTGWRAGTVNSTPILVDGFLWALAYPSGTLEELDPRTGAVLQETGAGRSVPHFASPSAAGGVLVAGTTSGVVAFA